MPDMRLIKATIHTLRTIEEEKIAWIFVTKTEWLHAENILKRLAKNEGWIYDAWWATEPGSNREFGVVYRKAPKKRGRPPKVGLTPQRKFNAANELKEFVTNLAKMEIKNDG